MFNWLISLLISMCLLAACSAPSSENVPKKKDNPETVSLEDYDKLETGMSYDEVTEILGVKGEVNKQTSEYIILEYKGDQLASGVILMFEDDMLTGKDKYGFDEESQ